MFGKGYGFCFNFLFKFLKSFRKRTQFGLGLGCAKDGAAHSESFYTSSTPSKTKRSTYFLEISPCNFGTGYGLNHTGFAFSFRFKPT